MRMLSLERKRKELMSLKEAKGQMKIGFWKSLRQSRSYVCHRPHIHTIINLSLNVVMSIPQLSDKDIY